VRTLGLVLGWRLRGQTWPHPYFDRATRAPSHPLVTLSRVERGARIAACREAIVAYAKSLRDEGLPVATVVAQVKALVRGAPARSAGMLRDALARWTISAFYQAD